MRFSPSTAPSGPSLGLSLSDLGTRVCTHRVKDRYPLPGWKIRSEPGSSQAASVWTAAANAAPGRSQPKQAGACGRHTCTAPPSSPLPPPASVQLAPAPLQHPSPPGAPEFSIQQDQSLAQAPTLFTAESSLRLSPFRIQEFRIGWRGARAHSQVPPSAFWICIWTDLQTSYSIRLVPS